MRIPTVDVLMPAYNAGKYIKESIQSILNQDYVNFNLIIVDDGSKDDTLKVINSFHDKRIIVYRNDRNTGLTKVRNQLVQLSTSKYILFQDADDISICNRISSQVFYLESNLEVGLVCSNAISINETSEEISNQWWQDSKTPISWLLVWENPIAQPTVCIRREMLVNSKLQFRMYAPAEDYDLWCRLVHHIKMHRLNEVLVKYRVSESSSYHLSQSRARLMSIKTNLQYIGSLGVDCPSWHISLTQFYSKAHKKSSQKHSDSIIKWMMLTKREWENHFNNSDSDIYVNLNLKNRIRNMIGNSQICMTRSMLPYILSSFKPIDYYYLIRMYIRSKFI